MPPSLRIRPYKDFLTPALHRRFTTAAVSLFGLCYVEALLIGEWNSWFWSWFPFGRAGIRTGLLFICAFSIFVLRVAQLHVGVRTTNSPFQTFQEYAFRAQTFQTAIWYLFSAWLYSEVYIFSVPNHADIKWIADSRNGQRPRLNERPIYLTSHFIMLGIMQTAVHLYYDYDRVDMPVIKTKPEITSGQRAHLISPPSVQLKVALPSLMSSSLKRALLMTLGGPFIYITFVRQTAWSWTLTFAKIFWNLPKSTALPAIAPFQIKFLGRTFTAGFLLIMLWEVANVAFSAYVAQEPLKNERPITYESRDPNGSLLTGLNGKKLQTRAFAFWELDYIAQRFQGRRKTIYEEIDRKGGSTWSQILEVCLANVSGISTRITEHLAPPKAPVAAAPAPEEPGLPRLAAPIKEDNIYRKDPPVNSRAGSLAQTVGSIAKAHGQSPSESPGKKLIDQAKAALKPQQNKALTPVSAALSQYTIKFLQSPVGWPFRQDYRRRMAVVLLGTPYGDVGILVDAVDAVTRLAVCSLTEDSYGNVQRDIATIIRTFTTAVAKLEGFKTRLGIHWTDIEKIEESPECDIVLAALRGGLNELLGVFSDYSEDLRLSQRDLREAREASTPVTLRTVEMSQK